VIGKLPITLVPALTKLFSYVLILAALRVTSPVTVKPDKEALEPDIMTFFHDGIFLIMVGY
jgi:hypothetical protein